MNIQQFHSALAGLVNSAIQNQVPHGTWNIYEILGALELCKLDLVRNLQDVHKEAAQSKIIQVERVPLK